MKSVVLAGVAFIALGMAGGALAAQPQDDDVYILSVVPRSPDVKPFFMSVPADGHQEKAAQPNLKAAAFEKTTEKLLASTESGKHSSNISAPKD